MKFVSTKISKKIPFFKGTLQRINLRPIWFARRPHPEKGNGFLHHDGLGIQFLAGGGTFFGGSGIGVYHLRNIIDPVIYLLDGLRLFVGNFRNLGNK